jgi:LuxR family transcriptional regulator, quorum-sensing system regulator SolR
MKSAPSLAAPSASALPEEVFTYIEAEARELGFEFCAYGLRMSVPITRPRTTYFTNYDPEWQRRYADQNYLEIDPTIAHGMRSSEPVVWSDEFFSATPQLWEEAQKHGLRHGVAQSRRDADGAYSMLVLARSQVAIEAAELAQIKRKLPWLIESSHVTMRTSCGAVDDDPAQPRLTEREICVLRWTADGKTSAEIAMILGLSERTVNFHVNAAVEKLGACNKTSAVVRAAMLGLMW